MGSGLSTCAKAGRRGAPSVARRPPRGPRAARAAAEAAAAAGRGSVCWATEAAWAA